MDMSTNQSQSASMSDPQKNNEDWVLEYVCTPEYCKDVVEELKKMNWKVFRSNEMKGVYKATKKTWDDSVDKTFIDKFSKRFEIIESVIYRKPN